MTTTVTRRDLFKFGGLAALGVAGASTLAGLRAAQDRRRGRC